MRYTQIRREDISDGEGFRVGIYTAGCHRHCKGCYNQNTWSFSSGEEFTEKTKEKVFAYAKPFYIGGLSVLGGEPLDETNLDELYQFFKEFKNLYPDKTIWVWTGYTYEELSKRQKEVLSFCDVLIDGAFDESKRDMTLKYRGSSNQRVIDLKKSKGGDVILYEV